MLRIYIIITMNKNNKNRLSYYFSKSFQQKWLWDNINMYKEFTEQGEMCFKEEGDTQSLQKLKILRQLNSNIKELKYVTHNEIMTLQMCMECVINYLEGGRDSGDKILKNRLRMTQTAKKSLARYTDKFISEYSNIDNYKY